MGSATKELQELEQMGGAREREASDRGTKIAFFFPISDCRPGVCFYSLGHYI